MKKRMSLMETNHHDAPSRSCNRFGLIFFGGMAGWTLLLCIWLYHYTIRGGGLPCWDEWERCAWASNIWYDLLHFDIVLFWNHTNTQVVWPFLHSWVTGILFVLFGPTLETARLVSLLSLFGSALILLYFFLKRADPFDWIAGIVAWILFSTSPLIIQHAASVMSELPGLFLVLLVLLVWPDNTETGKRRLILAGFFMGLLFYYKYNYAFLTYFALITATLFKERFHIRVLLSKQYDLLFGLPLTMLLLWLLPSFSRKIAGLVGFALNNPNVRMPFTLSSFLYYPERIPLEYFASPFFAIASLVLVVIAVFLSKTIRLTNPVVTCFLIHFLAAVIHPMKDARFMFIPMGLFFLLTGESVSAMLRRIFLISETRRHHAILLLLLPLLIPTFVYQTKVFRQANISKEQFFLAPIQTVINHTQKTDNIAFLISHDQISPPAITYYLTTAHDIVQSREDGSLKNWNYLFLFEPGEKVRALSAEERRKQLEYFLYIFKSTKIITIQSTAPWSIARFESLFGGTHEYAELVSQLDKFTLDFERDFKQTYSRVRVYSFHP